jgi:hypothetical protein
VASRYHLRSFHSFRRRGDGDVVPSSAVACQAAVVIASIGMLPAFGAMFGRATIAMIGRVPARTSPLMTRSRALAPLVREGIRCMGHHSSERPAAKTATPASELVRLGRKRKVQHRGPGDQQRLRTGSITV